jgi:ABC-2 type transport system ATP-binding protein
MSFKPTWSAAVTAILLVISGCGGSSSSTTSRPATNVVKSCTTPIPAEVQQHTVVSNLPNSFDTTRTPAATNIETTKFYVSVFLPERCANDLFPVVIQSHGYGGARLTAMDEDGPVDPESAHFDSINELFKDLPSHGYVGISIEQRGHGESVPANGGGYIRVIDPQAETQDTIALLDWIADNATQFQVETESKGIAKDFKVGLLGYSYGGGFQFPLALLDERVDTIVPNGTWHSIINSLLPGDVVKSSFVGFLCLFADEGGVANTPSLKKMCELVGYNSAESNNIRTRSDLLAKLAADPAAYTEEEVIRLFSRHVRHFQDREKATEPWCEATEKGCTSQGLPFSSHPIPTLIVQGNRDVLFNITESYWNWRYLTDAAQGQAQVSVLTTEGGHMNPLASQTEGTANCGQLKGVNLILAWFDFHLKDENSLAYKSIPKICISVADTVDAHTAEPAGLLLNEFPIGSQSGTGGVPVRVESIDADVTAQTTDPVFISMTIINGNDKVLAGIPAIDEITVTDNDADLATDITAIAYFGVGLKRGNKPAFLVDDQVTSLVLGRHTSNPNVSETRFLMPGIGERLQDGDELGLLFYQSHVQYNAVIGAKPPNPYTVVAKGVELPIINMTSHPTAAISK